MKRKPLRIKLDAGGLHRRLHVASSKTISVARIRTDLRTAKRTHNIKHIRQDTFALNARKWRKR